METDIRWKQRLANFRKAFVQLQEAVGLHRYSKLEQQGLIKCFEFTYELAWNTLKDYLTDQGYTNITGSRDTFRLSNRVGLIANGERWMEMVSSRNATSHTYDEETANRIADTIRQEYYYDFEQLLSVFDALLTDHIGPKKEDGK